MVRCLKAANGALLRRVYLVSGFARTGALCLSALQPSLPGGIAVAADRNKLAVGDRTSGRVGIEAIERREISVVEDQIGGHADGRSVFDEILEDAFGIWPKTCGRDSHL